jgi:hypothetical protein
MLRRSAKLAPAIVASIIGMWFSHHNKFRADTGGSQRTGRHAKIAALEERIATLKGSSDR